MKTTLLSPLRILLLSTALAIPAPADPTATASPSELLEKGIYSEETKGDIEEAISIYQQLIADAKSSQSFAAKAQFHLALCYVKKNRAAEATAAFEKLIHDFPEEKELVAKAREHVPGDIALEPVPWVDGERLQFNMKLPGGLDIGTSEYRADRMEAGGRKIWRVGTLTYFTSSSRLASTVDVEEETFRPISSHWKVSLIGEVSAIYKPGEVELRRAGQAQPSTVKFDGPAFDNEEGIELMRRLPFKTGYKTTLTVIPTITGSSPTPIGLEITGEEAVGTPAGKFNCYKLHMDIGQTFWFSTDAHRYLVKFEAGGAVAELASISQRARGETVPFHDEALGVSLTAPADWVVYYPKNRTEPKNEAILLMDPAADMGKCEVLIVPTESLSEESTKSARAWAEADSRKLAKSLKDVRIRPDSWKDRDVSGRSGISYIADFTDGGKPKIAFALHALGAKTSERFEFTCAPEKFDGLLAAFEGIIASYKTTK